MAPNRRNADEGLGVVWPNLRLHVVESDGGLEVEPAHGVYPNAELATEAEQWPGVNTSPQLAPGVEDGARGKPEVKGDHLVEPIGCAYRSAQDAARPDRTLGIPLTASIEEVTRPDEDAQEESQVVCRKSLELRVDDAVGGDQRGRNRSSDQVKARPEVEAEMPVALEHRGVGCSVALTAPDELELFALAQRVPLGLGLAAVGCPSGVLARAERIEVVAERAELGVELVDACRVDHDRIEAGAELVPDVRVAAHPFRAAGVLEMIETLQHAGEVRALDVTLDHVWRRGRSGIEAVDDVEGRSGTTMSAFTLLTFHHRTAVADREGHGAFTADRDPVPPSTTKAVGDAGSLGAGAPALDYEPRPWARRRRRRFRLLFRARADDKRRLPTRPEEAHDVPDVPEPGPPGGSAIESIGDTLKEFRLRQIHVDAGSCDLRRFRVGDAVTRVVRPGKSLEARVMCPLGG